MVAGEPFVRLDSRQARRRWLAVGLRVVINSLVACTILFGLTYILGDQSRFASPSFQAATNLFNIGIRAYGWAFMVVGLASLFAYTSGRLLVSALIANGTLYVFWGVLFFYGSVHNNGSFAAAIAFFALAACFSGCVMTLVAPPRVEITEL